LHLGYVGLAQFLPQVALVAFAGHATDVYNRKRVLMTAVALTAAAGIGLAVNSALHGPLWIIYLCMLAAGCARAFWMPARAAFLPRIVPLSIFPNAVSWNSSGFEIAPMVGPAIGGLLIGYFTGVTTVYALTAFVVLVFVFLLVRIRYTHVRQERAAITLRSLSAGLRFVWRTSDVLAVMMLDMFAVLLGGATALMPIYAKDILKVGPKGLGWLLAAPSIGAFTMALIQAHRRPLQRAGRTVLLSVAGFGVVTIVFGMSKTFWLSLLMLFLLGVFDNISVVVRTTLIQTATPDDMRGRVSALNGLFIGTSNELGAFESGAVAGLFGPVFSVVSGGIGTIVVAGLTAWLSPSLRRYGKLGSHPS